MKEKRKKKMRRLLIGLGGILLFLLIVAFLALVTLPKTMGVAVDWQALLKLQTPIFVTQYRIVEIERECFEKVSSLPSVGVDVWAVDEESIEGRTVDPVISKLRREGCNVKVLYETMDEYHSAVEGQ